MSFTDFWKTRPILSLNLAHDRKIEISNKNWLIFPEIDLNPGKLKFWENIWMSFPGIVNGG